MQFMLQLLSLQGCTQFLTNDEGFRNIAGLPVELLDEVLAT